MGARPRLRDIAAIALLSSLAAARALAEAQANPASAVEVMQPARPEAAQAAGASDADSAAPEETPSMGTEHEPAPETSAGDAATHGDAASPDVSTEPAQAKAGEDAPLPAPSDALESLALGATGDDAERGGMMSSGSLVRGVGALGVVLALILAARWVMVRSARGVGGLRGQLGAGGRSPSGLLQVLGRYPVARGQTLVLLKLDRRVLLLCQTQSAFSPLAEVTEPDEVASILRQSRDAEEESLSSRFNALLGLVERDPATARTDDIDMAMLRRDVAEAPAASQEYAEQAALHEPKVRARGRDDAVDGETELRRRLESLRGLGQ